MPPWLTGPGACDGFVVPAAGATMAVVSAAEDLGLAVGRDIDIVAKDAIPFLPRFRREIMTVHEDIIPIGGFLVKALMRRIADPGAEPMQFLDAPRLD
jgi:LacI family transcriptional regulator